MSYDIIVIGGGPGGYVAAIRAAQLGLNTALVEKHKIGGTCLNYGCIPTKAFYKSATLLSEIRKSETFGIASEGAVLDAVKLQNQKNETVDNLTSGVKKLLEAGGVDIYDGMALFLDSDTIEVHLSTGEQVNLSANNFIIATGSSVFTPQMKGIEHSKVVTSKEILEFEELPKELVILGGGVVAMEFASIFNDFGSEVTVVVRSSILKSFDKDIVKRAAAYLKKKGLTILTKTDVLEIRDGDTGVEVVTTSKKGENVLKADLVLNAMGRRPSYAGLNIERAGVEAEKGTIAVDDHFKTSKEHIYAIGDVNGKYMLAHTASHQGVHVVESIKGIGSTEYIDIAGKQVSKMDIVPSCVFISPELAGVGLSEDQAKADGIAVSVSKFPFTACGKAMAMRKTDGMVKLIALESGQLVGAQILGEHASDLIHEITLAIANELKVEDVVQTIHAHPTLSEAVLEAAYGLKEGALHMAPKKKA